MTCNSNIPLSCIDTKAKINYICWTILYKKKNHINKIKLNTSEVVNLMTKQCTQMSGGEAKKKKKSQRFIFNYAVMEKVFPLSSEANRVLPDSRCQFPWQRLPRSHSARCGWASGCGSCLLHVECLTVSSVQLQSLAHPNTSYCYVQGCPPLATDCPNEVSVEHGGNLQQILINTAASGLNTTIFNRTIAL